MYTSSPHPEGTMVFEQQPNIKPEPGYDYGKLCFLVSPQ